MPQPPPAPASSSLCWCTTHFLLIDLIAAIKLNTLIKFLCTHRGCTSKWWPSVWSPCFHTFISQPAWCLSLHSIQLPRTFMVIRSPGNNCSSSATCSLWEGGELHKGSTEKPHAALWFDLQRNYWGVRVSLLGWCLVKPKPLHDCAVACRISLWKSDLHCFWIFEVVLYWCRYEWIFFPLVFESRDSAVVAEIWPKPIQNIQLVDLQGSNDTSSALCVWGNARDCGQSGDFCTHVLWWKQAPPAFAATWSSLEPLHLAVNRARTQQRCGKSKWQKKESEAGKAECR